MSQHPKYGSLRAHQAQAIDEVERVAASGQKILVANRAGLISDRAAAALSPAKKTPEKAAVIHAAVEHRPPPR